MKPRKALRGLISRTEEAEVVPEIELQKVETILMAPPTIESNDSVPEIVSTPVPEIMSEPVVFKSSPINVESISNSNIEIVNTNEPLKLQYNFNNACAERQNWSQQEYLSLITRIDNAQTEAFLLKGKLLDEVKRRFFEDNKSGWKNFCENKLDLNYTTANQYIRVSQEFDVTSHQRPDFGFEHFKAMLPLPIEMRNEMLHTLNKISVKQLRLMVQEKLQPNASPEFKPKGTGEIKTLVKMLQNLKVEIFDVVPRIYSQSQRWQLSAAARNLSEELEILAKALNEEPNHSARHNRQGASATATNSQFTVSLNEELNSESATEKAV